LTDQDSFCRATRDVVAGKSVGGEDDPAEPPICQRQPGRSVAVRLNGTLSQPASECFTLRRLLSSNRDSARSNWLL